MISIRKSSERGHANHGWLDSYHTFSFADYYDPAHMAFRSLRVINEDRVAPGMGFGTHPHRDMEILTYVLEGALAHKDSMGNGSQIKPGEVQRLSAGTGITHSEFNSSKTEPVHLLQIWIVPEKIGLTPGYEQHAFSREEKLGKFRLMASHDARDGSVKIHQDVNLFAAILEPGASVNYDLKSGRHAWVQVARGAVQLNGKTLETGDGAAVSDEAQLNFAARQPSEILLFDLA